MSDRLTGSRTTFAFAVCVGVVAGVVGAGGALLGTHLLAERASTSDEAASKIDWPNVSQLMASASESSEGFSMATGLVDDDVEGLFILDHLTGDLRGLLINVRTGKFSSFYQHNVIEDLGTAKIKNPKYILLTGHASFRDGIGAPRSRLSRSAIYVAELDSGVVAAYAVPWMPGDQQFGRSRKGTFVALDRAKFRDIPLRDQ